MGLERSRAQGLGGSEDLEGSWPTSTSACSCSSNPTLGPWMFLEAEYSNGCCQVLPHSVSFILRPGSLGFASPGPRAVLCWLLLCCVSASTGKGLALLPRCHKPSSPSVGVMEFWGGGGAGTLSRVSSMHLLRVVLGPSWVQWDDEYSLACSRGADHP